MHFLVLESRPRSGYADTIDGYEFPARYLEQFAPLTRGEMTLAVIYEPRREGGRQAYIGWVAIVGPLARVTTDGARELWRVRYATGIDLFPRLVPRLVNGEAVESWLRPFPSRLQPNHLQGRAVRSITADDFIRVLTLGGLFSAESPIALPVATMEASGHHLASVREEKGTYVAHDTTTDGRLHRLVSVIQRDNAFRTQVVRAYDRTCAVSRFGSPSPAQTGLTRCLVDAAHIKPIAHGGGDEITNGIALTPTLHRLFDAGYFTLDYRGDTLLTRVSPDLTVSSLQGVGGQFKLSLANHLPVILPSSSSLRPDPQMLEYHRDVIFRR